MTLPALPPDSELAAGERVRSAHLKAFKDYVLEVGNQALAPTDTAVDLGIDRAETAGRLLSPENAIDLYAFDQVEDPSKIAVWATDKTAALAASFTAATTSGKAVLIPPGTHVLTDHLLWSGQKIHALGTLQGAPGKDVLRVSGSQYAFEGCHVTGRLDIVLDDSLNMSASLSRDGAGNACIATIYPDGAVAPTARLFGTRIDNLHLTTLSGVVGGQNASCLIYEQNPAGHCSFGRVDLSRAAFGWWQHYPTTGLTSVELAGDHNRVEHLYIGGCNKSGRLVNNAYCSFGTVILHNTPTGLTTFGVQSKIRNSCYHFDIDQIMIETATTPLSITGSRYTIANASVAGNGSLTIDADQVEIGVLNLAATTTPPLILNGDRIYVEQLVLSGNGSTAPFGRNLVQDNGHGNRIVAAQFFSLPSTTHAAAELTTDGRRLHERDSVLGLLGHVDPMPTSGRDLLVNPRWIVPANMTEDVGYSYLTDTAAPLGTVLRILSVGGNFFSNDNGVMAPKAFYVGHYLPPTRVRVYVCAKVAVADTQVWKVLSGGVDKGSGALSLGTGYTVRSFDIDLTGEATGAVLQLTVNGLAASGGPLDIAFVLFRPFAADHLVAGFSEGRELAVDPAAPSANGGRYYFRDNGAGKTQFCVRFPTGAVQVLATEP